MVWALDYCCSSLRISLSMHSTSGRTHGLVWFLKLVSNTFLKIYAHGKCSMKCLIWWIQNIPSKFVSKTPKRVCGNTNITYAMFDVEKITSQMEILPFCLVKDSLLTCLVNWYLSYCCCSYMGYGTAIHWNWEDNACWCCCWYQVHNLENFSCFGWC